MARGDEICTLAHGLGSISSAWISAMPTVDVQSRVAEISVTKLLSYVYKNVLKPFACQSR